MSSLRDMGSPYQQAQKVSIVSNCNSIFCRNCSLPRHQLQKGVPDFGRVTPPGTVLVSYELFNGRS